MLKPGFCSQPSVFWRINIDISKGLIIGREKDNALNVIDFLASKSVPICLVDIDRAKRHETQMMLIEDLLRMRWGSFWVAGGITSMKQFEL